MKDTFTLWALHDRVTNAIAWVGCSGESREAARACKMPHDSVVKLQCHIVQPQRKIKRGKYPNDNFGLPANYTPNNPDNLTREQVGEGFRLLADVEIWERSWSAPLYLAQMWCENSWRGDYWAGNGKSRTYRAPINTPLDPNPELKTK